LTTNLYVPEHGLNKPGGKGSKSNGGRGKPAISSTQKLPPNSLTAWPEIGNCWPWSAISVGKLCRSCKCNVPCRAAPRTAASSFWLSVDRASSLESTPSDPEQRLDEIVASILSTEPKDSGNILNYRRQNGFYWFKIFEALKNQIYFNPLTTFS